MTDPGAVFKHYRLKDPFPTSWTDPVEDVQHKQRLQRRQSTVRYSVLQEERSSTLKGLVDDEYEDATVLPDESDPLGTANSVVRVLKKRGLPVEDNVRLRSRYLVSSKNFSPTAFLRDVHAETPSPSLQQGLGFLSKSIAQKSGSLKVLVETNFDRFVAAKGTIEGVYREMKTNAFLDKESEYGVGKIRAYLNDAGTKADDVFGPIMTGRGREEGLRLLMDILEKHGSMLELPGKLADCVKRKDHEALVETFQTARSYLSEARALVPTPNAGLDGGAREEHIYQLIIAERMWLEAVSVTEGFKRQTWKRLVGCKAEDNAHTELIGILLELGVDDNPISIWLISRYEYLKNKITTTFERSRVEIEVVRRKVQLAQLPSTRAKAHHLRSATRRTSVDSPRTFDTPVVSMFWEVMHAIMSAMLDPSTGVLGEILSFWKVAQSFIDGDNLLPAGIDDQSRKHHRLSDEDVKVLREGALELVGSIRSCMTSFFQDPPVDDLSTLYSPHPITPIMSTDGELTPASSVPMPRMEGQADDGEVYAFFPPGANSLGGVHYLGTLIMMLGKAAASMAEIFSELGQNKLQEELRQMLSVARERTVKALSGAWLMDAQSCKVMEEWIRATDNRGVTKMPGYFLAFEKEVIAGMQSIVYLDKVRSGDTSIIPPPSAKFLANVRGQFVRTLYKALQGMVENAKRSVESDDETEGLTRPLLSAISSNLTSRSVDSHDKNVRMLLTLSNLQLLRSEIVPELISQFENAFSVSLTDESKTIRDALGQIDAQLFDEYTRPLIKNITTTVRNGIMSPSWSPSPGQQSNEVRPYVYDALLSMVEVHAQVTITAPSLVQQVLSYLLEQLSRELLESFRQRKRYSLGELLQATLDVEFINQTLTFYNTPKASEYQQLVYVELDKGSDPQSRQGLQKQLPEMKRILSSLRKNSRAEFLCFRSKKPGSRRTIAIQGEIAGIESGR